MECAFRRFEVFDDAQKLRGPRSCSKADLERVGVAIVSESDFHLQCVRCHQDWSPNILPGGRLPRDYWKCPNGCNGTERADA